MSLRLVEKKPELLCSFCGRNEDEVGAIAAGVQAFICDICVEIAKQTIDEIKLKRPRVTIEQVDDHRPNR